MASYVSFWKLVQSDRGRSIKGSRPPSNRLKGPRISRSNLLQFELQLELQLRLWRQLQLLARPSSDAILSFSVPDEARSDRARCNQISWRRLPLAGQQAPVATTQSSPELTDINPLWRAAQTSGRSPDSLCIWPPRSRSRSTGEQAGKQTSRQTEFAC